MIMSAPLARTSPAGISPKHRAGNISSPPAGAHPRCSQPEWSGGSRRLLFSDRHDVRSVETHQLNASVSGEWGQWRWTLWGRNLTDDTTFVRGFGTFGNDPRKEYALEPYRQFGEPRIVGLTLSYSLAGKTNEIICRIERLSTPRGF